ncbi:cardiolipin synthase ClsB [Marinobacter sp.]|uniref:cardiolipin synthase ClsB n=1 Tax=Marinobacter sp. TaxID=50741 RepID=UPI0038513793
MMPEQTTGNSISLLENGDEFFPRLIEAIDRAKSEILIETFIFRDDPSGREIHKALIGAASRGVWISLMVDGFGSYHLPQDVTDELKSAGIHYTVYHPQPRWLLVRTNIFRRLHRKIAVVDGLIAFIGGINLTYDHVSDSGPSFMVDYAAELKGPAVAVIRQFAHQAIAAHLDPEVTLPSLPPEPASAAGSARVIFLTRDNEKLRAEIEKEYLERIERSRSNILIANAYFYPGYRMLKALRDAARRGVNVRLLIPGITDTPLAQRGEKLLYDFLVQSGIEVYEYCDHLYHGKVAAFDDDWATIGSSNLDPISLSLNLEANIFVKDPGFNQDIREHIEGLIFQSDVKRISQSWVRHRTMLNWFLTFLIYHLQRYFPRLAVWLPPAGRRIPRSATVVSKKHNGSWPHK